MMSVLFIYLIRASIVTIIIFGLYVLYQKKENFFVLNRVYLLLGLLGALLLPLFNYDLLKYIFTEQGQEGYLLTYQYTSIQLPEIIIAANNISSNSLNWYQIIGFIYFTGFVTGLLLLLVRFFKLVLLSISHEKVNKEGIRFVLINDDLPVFSFFNNIFISKETLDSFNASKIIDHEKVHIRQFHSFDLLIAEVLCIVLWFNPFAYLLKKYMRENHEFLTDEKVIKIDNNPTAYRLLLLEYSSGIKTNSLAHNFSYSLLKRRLHMIKKPKRNLNFSVSVMTVAIAFSLVLFACSQPENSLSIEQNNTKGEIFTEAEVMPEYPGGMAALATFLGENIVYPEAAKSNSTEGKVVVSFVIDKDGSVTDVNTTNGIGNGCDEEAVRVVNLMPNWTPGYNEGEAVKVSFILPVMFKLGNSETKDSVYKVVEFMPEYPGGIPALMEYLGSNIKYPEQAKRDSIQGRVFVQFIVEKDGAVSGTTVLRGIGGGCDEEALRVVSSMPNWKPGLDENNEPVRVEYNIPIKYALK